LLAGLGMQYTQYMKTC